MAKAVLCPVCNGTGTILKTPMDNSTSGATYHATCHGCGGKGWVEVADEVAPYQPYTPWWEYQPYPPNSPVWCISYQITE
jgi:hypothetical protein